MRDRAGILPYCKGSHACWVAHRNTLVKLDPPATLACSLLSRGVCTRWPALRCSIGNPPQSTALVCCWGWADSLLVSTVGFRAIVVERGLLCSARCAVQLREEGYELRWMPNRLGIVEYLWVTASGGKLCVEATAAHLYRV